MSDARNGLDDVAAYDARTREEVGQLRNLQAHMPGGHCRVGAQCQRFQAFLALANSVGLLAQAGR